MHFSHGDENVIVLINKLNKTINECMVWNISIIIWRDRRGRMLIGFTTTYAIRANHHKRCGFEFRSWQGVLDTILCDKVCQWFVAGRGFSSGIPVSSTHKTDRPKKKKKTFPPQLKMEKSYLEFRSMIATFLQICILFMYKVMHMNLKKELKR